VTTHTETHGKSHRHSDTNWGRWGDDDERGAQNLLTDDVVLAATRQCRTGRVYRLALPLKRVGVPLAHYRGAPQRLTLLAEPDPLLRSVGIPEGTGACEDVLILPSHSVTHMDALCHVFSEGKFYNGFPASGFRPNTGAEHCGIEKNGGFVARAVLLDMARFVGERWLDPSHVIAPDEIADCAARQGVEIRPADVVMIRTGWQDMFLEAAAGGETLPSVQPGIGIASARYLAELDVSAVGSDNSGIEPLPFPPGEELAVHVELLVRRGVFLIENLWLAEMAGDQCYESLFIVAPLNVPGASGSPVTPIAIG
jgi:kynurenine formamidase